MHKHWCEVVGHEYKCECDRECICGQLYEQHDDHKCPIELRPCSEHPREIAPVSEADIATFEAEVAQFRAAIKCTFPDCNNQISESTASFCNVFNDPKSTVEENIATALKECSDGVFDNFFTCDEHYVPHVFDPWNCDSCRFEAEHQYESKSEKEIADKWRAEQVK